MSLDFIERLHGTFDTFSNRSDMILYCFVPPMSAGLKVNKVFFHPTQCLHTHTFIHTHTHSVFLSHTYKCTPLHMYRCLMGSPCSAALSSGYAQTYYMSLRAWMRAMLVPSILGHKRGLCPRTAGPFKTGLSLIGHTSVALSRLRASQLIREAEQSRSLTSRSALNLSYSKQGISF